MIRLEIISNNTIEIDLLEQLRNVNKKLEYSKISPVHGMGRSIPKMGDAIWPEENFIYIIYCSDDVAPLYADAVRKLKKEFPNEGVKIFSVPCMEIS